MDLSQINSEAYALTYGILLAVLFPFCVVVILFVFKRRNLQPLKKKSPLLILISIVGNFLFVTFILMQQISRQSCVEEQKDGESPSSCSNSYFISFNCFLGFFLLAFCEPLAIFPYYLRTYRLHQIFKAQNQYVICGEKPKSSMIKERQLFQLALLISAILLAICLVLFFSSKSLRGKLPSYTADLCFVTNLGEALPQNDTEEELTAEIQQHMNVSYTVISFLYFLENCVLLLCIFSLRQIQKDFSILYELQAVLVAWFLCGNASLAIMVFEESDLYFYAALLLIIRCIASIVAAAMPPLYQSYRGSHYIPIPPPIDGLERLDMVLHIPLAADAFYEYLDQLEDAEAPVFFALYADLRTYDRACTQEDPADDKYSIAQQILDDYLEEGSEYFVKVSAEVSGVIKQRFLDLKANLNEYLFIELYAFVLDKLRAHYDKFKMSPNFSALQKEIERQEKLYDVLVDASIITN